MNHKPHLSVIVPAYNESKNFDSDTLERAYAYLSKRKYEWELILVDDGSTDDTLDKLRRFANGKAGGGGGG
jgi:glycosyltransferase involved in cell wall biosynthesis